MEALYAHYPGLIVMTPATVEDAYSMLLEAVAIDDPVIFCEHKYLYYHLKAEALPTEALPTGKARIARAGPRRHDRDLQRDGARSARRAPRNSRRKAGRSKSSTCARSSRSTPTPCSPASRAPAGCSPSAKRCRGAASPPKSIARVASEGFGLLDAPPLRLNAKDTPVPYHPNLWGTHRPTREDHRRRMRATSRALNSPFLMPQVPIIMPQLGESIAEATIVALNVKPGDKVESRPGNHRGRDRTRRSWA